MLTKKEERKERRGKKGEERKKKERKKTQSMPRDAITSRFSPPNFFFLSCLLVLLRAFECAYALHFLVLLLLVLFYFQFSIFFLFSLIFNPFIKLVVIFELNCPFRTDMVRGKKIKANKKNSLAELIGQ
jgi:hypothetical protein